MPTPSFILPSAPVYEEGTLYGLELYGSNFVPSPMSFTRATTATRVNADGLVELVPYNLLQYSEQFNNAAWVVNNATVTVNTTTAPNGTLTADTITNVSGSLVGQQVTNILIGQTFTFSIYLKRINGIGAIILTDVNGGVVPITITNEWHKYYVTSTSTSTLGRAYFRVMTTGDSVAAWGAQLVEGTAALPYLKTETRLNRPRVDFSLGGCPNLLLEPQRTNLVLQSSSFDSGSWAKVGATITANSVVSPSGVQDADTITQTGVSLNINQVINIAAAGNYTYSVYVKKGNFDSSNNFRFGVYQGSDLGYITFNFATNTTSVISGTFVSHSSKSVGNDWYLIQYTINIPTTGSTNFYNGGTGGNIGAGNFFYSWGAQLEAGAYETSYIPTTATSVTRNADSFTESNVFTKGMITAAGGTWFVELKNNIARTRDTFATSLFLGTAISDVGTDGFSFVCPSSLSRMQIRKYVASTPIFLYITTTDTTKIAIVWNGATADIFANGTKVISATAFNATTMQFLVSSGVDVPKYIQQMALFPTPLSDDELEALTGTGFNTYAEMANYYNYIIQ